jgi:hypothetical protein
LKKKIFSFGNKVEAISKIEKWFEVKPPAPLPARRAYRPEGRTYAPEGTARNLKNPDHRSEFF